MRAILSIAALLTLASCTAHKKLVEPPPAQARADATPSFIDLEPGWRLRVITPVLKSGGFRPKLTTEQHGNTVTVKTDDDFTGYETADYAVSGNGRIEFVSATITAGGATTPQSKPIAPLFAMPVRIRCVRLVYLTRLSESDHDMAVVGAADRDALQSATAAIRANRAQCKDSASAVCSWIPTGIAVRPEVPAENGEWLPAR